MKTRNMTAIAIAAFMTLFAASVFAIPDSNVEKTTFSTDNSDLWWNPEESGWGMQLVQQRDFVFATLFVYGADGKPTWMVAQLASEGAFTFSGPVFVTTGPWYGSVFNPGAVGVRQAGTMTFQSSTICCGTVSYVVDGVAVTKQIQRQNLVGERYDGAYVVTMNLTGGSCVNAANDGATTVALGVGI